MEYEKKEHEFEESSNILKIKLENDKKTVESLLE